MRDKTRLDSVSQYGGSRLGAKPADTVKKRKSMDNKIAGMMTGRKTRQEEEKTRFSGRVESCLS